MAKRTSTKKMMSMEEALWKSADKLRGSVEPAEYKHVVLSLIFLKYSSDRFEEQRKKIIAEGIETEEHIEILRKMGGDFLQGYYYSKPLNEKDFIRFIDAQNEKRNK